MMIHCGWLELLSCLLLPLLYTFAPRNWIPGELVTSGMMNTLRDLFLAIERGDALMRRVKLFRLDTSAEHAAYASSGGNAALMYYGGYIWESCDGRWWENTTIPSSLGPHDLYISARAMYPHPVWPCGAITDYTFSDSCTDSARQFTEAAFMGAYWEMVLPKRWDGGYVTITPYFFALGAGGPVLWQVYACSIGNNETLDQNIVSLGSIQSWALGAAYLVQSVDSLRAAMPGGAKNDYLRFQFFRNSAAPEDTYPTSVYLLGVKLTFDANNWTDG